MDSPVLFSACAFLMLLVILSWVGYRLVYKPGRFLKQLGNPVIGSNIAGKVVADGAEPEASTVVTLLQQIGSRVPSSEAEVASLKVDLIRAGFRSDNALTVFYGIRIISTLLFMMIGVMLAGNMPPNPVMKIGLGGMLPANITPIIMKSSVLIIRIP